ncbi:hypothetical protein HBB16_09235 [Pseudonocardia sp. MCCB 268]|nr:hypothetical protein [Pseudonocardia cytotoxica]
MTANGTDPARATARRPPGWPVLGPPPAVVGVARRSPPGSGAVRCWPAAGSSARPGGSDPGALGPGTRGSSWRSSEPPASGVLVRPGDGDRARVPVRTRQHGHAAARDRCLASPTRCAAAGHRRHLRGGAERHLSRSPRRAAEAASRPDDRPVRWARRAGVWRRPEHSACRRCCGSKARDARCPGWGCSRPTAVQGRGRWRRCGRLVAYAEECHRPDGHHSRW